MISNFTLFWVPVIAVVLDLIIKDPDWLPHPVRYVGKFLDFLEDKIRNTYPTNLKKGGWIAVAVVMLGLFIPIYFICKIPVLGAIIALYLSFAGLALGCLLGDARKAARLINSGQLDLAREAVGGMVTRETGNMDADQLRQSLAETVSENITDGFTGPFLYMAIFGPAGLWAYKGVSTMDSMWGYKNEKYSDLGYAAAKMDDWLNFIPARITAFVMIGVGYVFRMNWQEAYDKGLSQTKFTESPNSGWTMAVSAWLVGGAMGGKAVYDGVEKDKPVMGPEGETWTDKKLRKLNSMVLYSSLAYALVCHLYFYIFRSM